MRLLNETANLHFAYACILTVVGFYGRRIRVGILKQLEGKFGNVVYAIRAFVQRKLNKRYPFEFLKVGGKMGKEFCIGITEPGK